MKTLVAYYSRTGTTKKVAESISNHLKCDIEEIFDTANRKGVLGFIKSGKDAIRKAVTLIKPPLKDPKNYDLTIIGTPVWSNSMTPAIRTYLKMNKDKFNKVAFFCTMGGSGDKNTFKEMETLCIRRPIATLSLKTKQVKEDNYSQKIKDFIL